MSIQLFEVSRDQTRLTLEVRGSSLFVKQEHGQGVTAYTIATELTYREVNMLVNALGRELPHQGHPIPVRLRCEVCHELHIDEGEFATKPHHTHACQYCGHVWRPAVQPTVGVRHLPGFKNDERQPNVNA